MPCWCPANVELWLFNSSANLLYGYSSRPFASSATTAYTIKAAATAVGGQNKDNASGATCANLYYTYGVDSAVNTACSVTTVAGQFTICPASCWSR